MVLRLRPNIKSVLWCNLTAVRNDWDAIAGLVDGTRRRLYDHLRLQPRPVSREEAADALQISRSLAAFHLDKLVELGLVIAGRDRSGEGRRGRGRPPKVYAPAVAGVSVSVPEQRYEVLAEILASAVTEDPERADLAAREIAEATGRRIGAEGADGGRGLPEALEDLGYRPRVLAEGRIRLENCPFRESAVRHRSLVCALNHAFLTGVLDGRAAGDVQARALSHDLGCCVEVVAKS